MLVYIKTSCTQEILQDVSEEDVDTKVLIERELTKEIEELANQYKFYEVIVFTSNVLQNDTNMKSGQNLFDSNRGLRFHIEKEKSLGDLYELLLTELGGTKNHFLTLWLVNIKKDLIRVCDTQSNLDKPLNKMSSKGRIHFYVEILSSEHPSMDPFQKNKHALIFIKEYDSVNKRLIFHTHQYIMLNETVANLQAFIKNAMKYDGDAENIAIIVEKGIGEQHTCREWDAKHPISKIVTKFMDTYLAMVVFEILDKNRRPMYIRFAGAQNPPKQEHAPLIEEIENGIDVTVKNDDTGEEYIQKKFSPCDRLSSIVHSISGIQVSVD